ncbi:uncharacterized protein [Watersipora subatra]|uniref:uncharacterized protein n=1 Tax=Watersipora subatra TaxID=2589382 RepID=UPI00355B7E89
MGDQVKSKVDQHRQLTKQINSMTQLNVDQGKKKPCRALTKPTLPKFSEYDPATELLSDYMNRYDTFVAAHSIPEERKANVFLLNQSPVLYKEISHRAGQLETPKLINEVTMEEIDNFLKEQHDPIRFLVRERYKFWSTIKRKPRETIHELANRIRQEATTCDLSNINDTLNEAIRTRFVCLVNNEAVLKALFKVKETELSFKRAIEVATETEDAAKIAKETVYGEQQKVHKVQPDHRTKTPTRTSYYKEARQTIFNCYSCNETIHTAKECPYRSATCNFCQKLGHLGVACRKRKATTNKKPVVQKSTPKQQLKTIRRIHMEQLQKSIEIGQQIVEMELDTEACYNFIIEEVWCKLGKPVLSATTTNYESASKHRMEVIGQC